MTNRESDDRIVPTKPGNSGGGKAVKPSRESSRTPFTLSGEPTVTSRLDRFTNRAELHPTKTFTNLFTLINVDLLRMAESKYTDCGASTAGQGLVATGATEV